MVLELVNHPLMELGELYENSLKAMLVCGLEFYLSASLVASFFHCPDVTREAEQELRTLYTLVWVPMLLAAILVYGPKISSSIFPSPDHFEQNMLRCKILTWIYAFVFLISDRDMVIKTGPSLGVSILFSVVDVGRFIMDMKHLTDVEYDEHGNSIIINKTTRHDTQQPQQQSQPQKESYTVHIVGDIGQESGTGQDKPRSAAKTDENQKQSEQPPTSSPVSFSKLSHLDGSRGLLGVTRDRDKRELLLESPSEINTEFAAVLDPEAQNELNAKESFTYEF